MATYRGTDGSVRVASATVAEVTSFTLNSTQAVIADNSLGDEWDTHLVGRGNWSGTITANTDPGDTAGQRALALGASVVLNLYPTGTASGRILLSGTGTVTSVEYSNNHDNTVAGCTFQFTGNGALGNTLV